MPCFSSTPSTRSPNEMQTTCILNITKILCHEKDKIQYRSNLKYVKLLISTLHLTGTLKSEL